MSINQREFSTPNDGQQYHVCPCCGTPFGHRYTQPALVAGRPDKTYVHCMDKDCPMYTVTMVETPEAIAKAWALKQLELHGGVA